MTPQSTALTNRSTRTLPVSSTSTSATVARNEPNACWIETPRPRRAPSGAPRSEEHTSELQSLMRISYAVFCLKKKNLHIKHNPDTRHHNMTQQINPTLIRYTPHTKHTL